VSFIARVGEGPAPTGLPDRCPYRAGWDEAETTCSHSGAIRSVHRCPRGVLVPDSFTKRGWRDRIAALQARAAAGEVSAQTDLGLTLQDGIQDQKGRALVRRAPRAALVWLRQAANRGDATAAGSLGYAYDRGLGTRASVREAIRWYRRAVRGGSSTAATNLATVYRDAGNARRAFQWWRRSDLMGDADAAVDVGYGYQYGIGTRRSTAKAHRTYRRAIASRNTSEYSREAAMYHLALLWLDGRRPQRALPLLRRASADDDYPEAATLLRQLQAGSALRRCRCKRGLGKALRGHARCMLHAKRTQLFPSTSR